MTAELRAPAEVQHPDRFFADGIWIEPSTNAVFDVVDPATEELYYRAASAQPADMDRVVGSARQAFDHGPWPRMSHAERAEYLVALGEGLIRRARDLSRIWSSESGAVYSLSAQYCGFFGEIYKYYAGLAGDFPFVERHRPTAGGSVGLLVREPVGVVGAIVPWNSAMGLIAYKTAPALLAGCTVVVKSPPEAPGSAYVFAEVAEEAGVPPGVINIVTADREVSELLVRDPRVDKITFTGSTAVGRRIGALCAERVARCNLELGGKSAALILDDFDLGTAANALSASARVLAGQNCSNLSRIIVSRHRHDEFVEALSESFAKTEVGDPYAASTEMGPLSIRRQRDRVEGYIAKGIEQGAMLATGGGRPEQLDRGYYIEPTVFADVDNGSVIAQEEIFGPVLSVIPADSEDHAIELANDTIYGLNSAVFTDDPDRALRCARRVRAGTVGHNAYRQDFGIAFGGFKQSGIGREGAREGLFPFLETKTVVLDAEPSALRMMNIRQVSQ